MRDEARSALANSQFYLTWLMRLEGAAKDEWEPHIDAARQHYKLLAESAEQVGDEALVTTAQHDLEAAIRLARLDLADLQGSAASQPMTGLLQWPRSRPSRNRSKGNTTWRRRRFAADPR